MSLLVMATACSNPRSFVAVPTQPGAAPIVASAFLSSDVVTQGNSVGAYGSEGNIIALQPSTQPSYAYVSEVNDLLYNWASNTTTISALQYGTSRQATCFYSGTSFSLDVFMLDGAAHHVSLYLVDFDHQSRAETVTVSKLDGTIVDVQTISNFSGGVWLTYRLVGDNIITISRTAGVNAVLSGIFFN